MTLSAQVWTDIAEVADMILRGSGAVYYGIGGSPWLEQPEARHIHHRWYEKTTIPRITAIVMSAVSQSITPKAAIAGR
jgi:hypothetical protein